MHFPAKKTTLTRPSELGSMAITWFRRKNEPPWEVVGCEIVEPVFMFDGGDELDVVRVRGMSMSGKYIFDFKKHAPNGAQGVSTVLFARQQLMQEITKKSYNILLIEGWTLTRLRQGKHYRIEVDYTGRPGYVSGKLPVPRPPPFIAVLEGRHMFS
ncbi:hypothetical protein BDN67DRAFT_987106 [Paxillus ammoniavirescens]|nr:hypothetical protein BDN67DRAFT_987106 [Paxillus ammoniavirescens]